jgi:hypothetical protein
MHKKPHGPPAHPGLDHCLEDLVRLVADEARAARLEARRERRRVRVLLGALAALVIAAGWSVLPARSVAQVAMPGDAPPAPLGADERAARRAELIAVLPAEKRRELERSDSLGRR